MRSQLTVQLADGWRDEDGTCSWTLVVDALSGADEEWVGDLEPNMTLAAVTTDLLARCVRGPVRITRASVAALTVSDRARLLLALWRASYGERMDTVLTCPHADCGAQMDSDFDIDAAAFSPARRPEVHRVVRDGVEIRFRLPRGDDLEAAGIQDGDALLARCLVDAPPLAALTRASVEAVIQRLSTESGDELEGSCPECERAFVTPFHALVPLLTRVARGRAQLDHDVHLLSFHYHWAIDVIRELPRPRRRAYVQLLHSHLQPEAQPFAVAGLQ